MKKTTVCKRMLQYLKAYRLRLFFVLLFAAVSTLFMVMAPFLIGKITTTLFDSIRDGIFYWETIFFLIAALVALYLISQFFSLIQGFGMAKITAGVMEKLRGDIDAKMHRLKLDYYDTHTHGDILSVITNDVDTINNTISQNLTSIVTQMITAVGILIMMLQISPSLTLIPVILVPLSLVSAAGVMKASGHHYSRQQELLGRLNGYIEELYNGQQVVQSFGYEKRAEAQFGELNEALRDSSCKAETMAGAISPITTLVNDAGYVLCAAIGCIRAIAGTITVGNVQAMLEYARKFAEPFSSLAGMAGSFGAAAAAGSRIFSLLDAPEEVPDGEHCIVPENHSGNVVFRNVQFGYSADRMLMKNVNVEVHPGQKAAIVGPTGAGKTTMIKLLMRFYDVNSGEILIDGHNLKDFNRSELRQMFGMVLQDTWLFHGSIKDNIRYGKLDATDEEVVEAAKAAYVHRFVQTLPDGYDMELNEEASNVSQGQKQLLTIARAILADPKILILDEATSSVDTRTEIRIQKAMDNLMKGRTSFIIAHRLSTIRDADLILVMKDGDIVEQGNHEELLEKGGFYANLYNSQFEQTGA